MIQVIKAFLFGLPIKGEPVSNIKKTTHEVKVTEKRDFNDWVKETYNQ